MTDGSGETYRKYDLRERMVEEVKTILNLGTYTTQWRYDNQDRVQQMFYPNGDLVSFVYNYQGELAQIKRNALLILAHRRFNEHGQVVREYFGNNTVRNYQYGDWLSTSGAISQIQAGLRNVENDSSLQNLGYTYDLIGNITELNDNGEILNFGYDDLNRLTSVSGAYQQSYTYDKKTGNLLTKSDVGNNSNYVYSSTSHPHAVTGYGAQSNLFEYDANGQMIKRYTKDITYDAQGQLVSYDGDNHVYDGDGNRVMTENANGEATVYIGNYYEKFFDIPGFIDPVEPPEQQQRSQVYKNYLPVIQNGEAPDFETVPGQIYYYAGMSRIATRTEEGKIIWIYGDHLGSTSVTADKNGNELSRTSYYAWGTTRSSAGVQETDYGYTGQMQVGDIYYYNARWYDPQLGRFMQADTIVPPHQGTQGFDRYAYVNNNPLRYTDPSGHWFRNTNLLMHDGGGGIGSRQVYQSSDPSNNSEEILNIVVCGLGGGLCATSGEPLFRYNDYPGGIHKTYDVDNYQGYKKDALSDELVTYIMSKANARFRIIGHSAGADAVILTAYKLKELGFEDKLALVVLLDPTLSALPYNEPVGSLSDELYGILDANIKVAVGISHGYTVYEVAMAPFFNNETITSYSNYFYQYYAHDNHTTIATSILINFDILLSE